MSYCPYCDGGPGLEEFAYKVGDLSPHTAVYLFKEQSHPGRMVAAYKGHVSEITDLAPEELAAYMADVARIAAYIHKEWKPDKINYGAYGDLLPHLHFHLAPKYKDDFEWGGTFHINPHKKELTKEEAQPMIEKIRADLNITG